MLDRKLFGGLARMHILHHACHEPIFGVGIMEELARHGPRVQDQFRHPLPFLHSMVKQGYLVSSDERVGGRIRKNYTATEEGRAALALANPEFENCFSSSWRKVRSH